METEEKDVILPASEPEPAACTDAASAEPAELPETSGDSEACAQGPSGEPASEPAPDQPAMEVLEDGSRILRIPRGYEAYPDGWYPKNPVRRFMERWGAFLNLGLTLFLLIAVGIAAVSLDSVPVSPPAQTEPAVLPTEATEEVPMPSEQMELPTMPPIDVPVQTDCFRAEDGVLFFDEEAFRPTPILQIPETVDGQQIISIGAGAFEGLSGVTTLLLPEGLRTVGDRAFAGCPDLRGVCLPATARQIGTEAFRGCTALESIYMPGSVHRIGEDAFEDCAALHYIFFNGPHSRWEKLYTDFITPFTFIFCLDGEFSHGAQLPG